MTATGLLEKPPGADFLPAPTPSRKPPEIRLWGDPILETPPAAVTHFGEDSIIPYAIEQLKAALGTVRGYGVAGPQVNIPLQIAYVKLPPSRGKPSGEDFVMINPRITYREKRIHVMEGCLSIPKFFHTLNRFYKISFEYQDERGELVKRNKISGLFAQVIQHECEHLEGRLMIEHVRDRPAKREAARCIEKALEERAKAARRKA